MRSQRLFRVITHRPCRLNRATRRGSRGVRVVIALSIAAGVAACDRAESDIERAPQLLSSASSPDSLTWELAAKQRELNAGLASKHPSVANLISDRFTLFDASDPTAMSRDPVGDVAF